MMSDYNNTTTRAKDDTGTASADAGAQSKTYESAGTNLLCAPDGGYYYPPACEHSKDMDTTLEPILREGRDQGLVPPEDTPKSTDNADDHISPQTPKGDPQGDTTIKDHWNPDYADPPTPESEHSANTVESPSSQPYIDASTIALPVTGSSDPAAGD